MSRHEQFYEQGRTALTEGRLRREVPPVDGGRRGISVIVRPTEPAMSALVDLAAEAAARAGGAHWVHDRRSIHMTVQAHEPHSTRDLAGDQRVHTYASVLDDAAAATPPFTVEYRGVAPHFGGVPAFVEQPQSLRLLRKRLLAALQAHEVVDLEANFDRDLWYCGLLHFAAVPDVPRLLDWAEENRHREIGESHCGTAELVKWHYNGRGVETETLHAARLGRP